MIKIDEALRRQIGDRIVLDEHKKHEVELKKAVETERLRAKGEIELQLKNERTKAMQDAQKLKLEYENRNQQAMFEIEKVRAEYENKLKSDSAKRELEFERLIDDIKFARENEAKLRDDYQKQLSELRKVMQERDDAKLKAATELAEKEANIRSEEKAKAFEEHRFKELEKDKQIADMQKALQAAQQKAEQKSEQNQGEVLELDIEDRLKHAFPQDKIEGIKKGIRGADVLQTVINQYLEASGKLLYETKNAAWQNVWIDKFKGDLRVANADIGILISRILPDEYGDMKQIADNVWVVKPNLAIALATAMRTQIINIYMVNRNQEGKDQKMEAIYRFLTGPDFKNRIEAIVDNYTKLQDEIEAEKRSAQLRWNRQDKAIRAVIDNTFGMYGDLQGITGGAITSIKQLEDGE
jgi:hypothetical protein